MSQERFYALVAIALARHGRSLGPSKLQTRFLVHLVPVLHDGRCECTGPRALQHGPDAHERKQCRQEAKIRHVLIPCGFL